MKKIEKDNKNIISIQETNKDILILHPETVTSKRLNNKLNHPKYTAFYVPNTYFYPTFID